MTIHQPALSHSAITTIWSGYSRTRTPWSCACTPTMRWWRKSPTTSSASSRRRGLPDRSSKRRRSARAGRPRHGRRRLRRLCRRPAPPVDTAIGLLRTGTVPMDKVSLTALARQHLAAAHGTPQRAHRVRRAPTHIATNPDCPDRRHQPRRPREPRQGHTAGLARVGSADQSRHQLGRPPRRSPRHPLHPPRPARRRRLRRLAPSPNLFSATANRPMTTICLGYAANSPRRLPSRTTS
jgi:hypothetical protein